jgi:hypothetical protein
LAIGFRIAPRIAALGAKLHDALAAAGGLRGLGEHGAAGVDQAPAAAHHRALERQPLAA